MKKQNIIPIVALLALVSLMITPVMAETLTGTLGGGGSITDNYEVHYGQPLPTLQRIARMFVKNIEYTTGTSTIVVFLPPVETFHFTNFTPTGNTTSVILKYGEVTIGNGIIGYQRVFAGTPPVEQDGGYMWISLYSYNTAGLTGNKVLTLIYDNLDGLVTRASSGTSCVYAPDFDIPPESVGYMVFCQNEYGSASIPGEYIYQKADSATASYTVTKPSGLGITGNVIKDGTTSQVSIYDGATKSPIASEYSISANPFSFNVPKETAIVSILSSLGTRYNSSVLFTTAVPTPTPVPTIPAGYVKNTFVTIDGVNYNTIHGSNIMLRDVENNSWSNSTSDADGIFYIDTLPYHTINAYATYTVFENHYGDAELIGVETGNSGMDYPIYMFPPGLYPGPGNINLYIPVVDRDTSTAIGSVGVQVELPTGAIIGDITGPGGDAAVFVVPNNTVIRARASKTGYGPITESFNSGEVSPKTKTLYMHKLVVTIAPTSTIPTGGITPVVTLDPRPDVKKATDAFSKWMSVLGDITDIAIGVVIIWLMWLTVYMITGGKIIDKIMKRGRGR